MYGLLYVRAPKMNLEALRPGRVHKACTNLKPVVWVIADNLHSELNVPLCPLEHLR